MRHSRVGVAGVPVDPVSEEGVLERVASALERKVATQIATVNAEYVVRARRNPDFLDLLRRTAINTVDGHGVLWAVRRRGAGMRRRVGGSDLVWSISDLAAREGYSVFLLGARPGVARAAAERLRVRFPDLRVAGTHAGSPAPEDEAGIVDLIRQKGADIVFVAYGSPEQDFWIERNLPRTSATVAMGVGGSFDYVAGVAVRAPVWMQEHGLDWLWRLMREPWRWRRMLSLPVFLWMAWRAERRELAERNI